MVFVTYNYNIFKLVKYRSFANTTGYKNNHLCRLIAKYTFRPNWPCVDLQTKNIHDQQDQ